MVTKLWRVKVIRIHLKSDAGISFEDNGKERDETKEEEPKRVKIKKKYMSRLLPINLVNLIEYELCNISFMHQTCSATKYFWNEECNIEECR